MNHKNTNYDPTGCFVIVAMLVVLLAMITYIILREVAIWKLITQ